MKSVTGDATIEGQSLDISKNGLKVSLNRHPFKPFERITISLNEQSTPILAEIRWIDDGIVTDSFSKKTSLIGLKFLQQADWPISIANINWDSPLLESHLFSRIFSLIDEQLILFNRQLSLVWANKSQKDISCIFQKIPSRASDPYTAILDLSLYSGQIRDLLKQLLALGEKARPILVPSFSLMSSNQNTLAIPFNLYITPLQTDHKLEYILLKIQYLNNSEMAENIGWIDCRYQQMGRLFENMLEEIVNPLAAVIGRVDLLSLRIGQTKDNFSKQDISLWRNDIKKLKKDLDRISNLCRITLQEKDLDTLQHGHIFSLSDLVKNETEELTIRRGFKGINLSLQLDPQLPRIKGEYELWALAFNAICHILQKKFRHADRKILHIETSRYANSVILQIQHTASKLRTPLHKEPGLSVLSLLQKEYLIHISVEQKGIFQIITLSLPLIIDFNLNSFKQCLTQ